ncbi:MAG TPA: rhomboid family intramembrane serine protease [Terracidiphilus sp.]|jgi:membrane associated rhomboid family serine protease|nr:rhomboid family intramembrane serine protease [Terracidiphilus sp.]
MGGLIPLGDASRPERRAFAVTVLIILLNVFVFFLELQGGNRFVYAWSAVPIRIVHGYRVETLLTSMFMHGGFLHIIGNMIYLWAFGPSIEQAMGWFRFLLFYLAGGLVAMMAQVAADPFSNIPVLGASGAIAAVMGAFIITYPRDRIKTLLFLFIFIRITYIPAALLIGFWFLMQVFSAGSVAAVRTGGVAYLAHIAGFLFGVITARFIEKRRQIGYPEDVSWRR